MNSEEIKKQFAVTIKWAQASAAIFFLLLTPNIVMTVKEKEEIFGFGQDFWFNASIAGFVIYMGFVFLFWKCPKCGKYPGRGWFRKSCDKCGVELS